MLFSLANPANLGGFSLTLRIYARYLETGKALFSQQVLEVDAHGRVASIRPLAKGEPMPTGAYDYVVPGCVNAHSHAFQVLLRPTTGQPQHFKDWVDRFLYPCVLALDEERLFASAVLVFHEMLRAGITTVGEFHYVNNLPDGQSSDQLYARTLIRAAETVGLRICLIRTLYDQAHKPGQIRFQESLDQAISQTEALAQAYADHPLVSVLPAPHSLHGASRDLICAGAKLAKRLGTPWHIHLAEQPSDAEFALERYGLRPLACLEEWGLLDADACIVHGIWFDDADLERMQRYGCRQVYNPLTNMALGDGIARLPELLQRGVPVALGTDANTDSSLFLEARMAEYLQRSQKLSMGHVSADQLFTMTNRYGAHALGLSTGHLAVGQAADFLGLDLSSPSMLSALCLDSEASSGLRQNLLNQLLFSAVPQEVIQGVYVAGKKRVEAGKHLSVDIAACFQSVFS